MSRTATKTAHKRKATVTAKVAVSKGQVVPFNPQNIVKETGLQLAGAIGHLMVLSRDPKAIANTRETSELIKSLMAWQARQAYSEAMAKCQRAIPYIQFDKQAEGGAKQKYVTLEKMHRVAKPILEAHGFSLSYGTEQAAQPGWIRLRCDCLHTGGHTETYYAPEVPPDTTGPAGTQNKTGVQGAGSSISYMQRYLMKLIFNITVTGEDNDGQTDTLSEPEMDMLRKAVEEGAKVNPNITIGRVLELAKVETLAGIRRKDFGKIMAGIANSSRK